MDNIIDTQKYPKSNIKTITLIFAIGLALLCVPTFNAYAVPPEPGFWVGNCADDPESLSMTCCWKETGEDGSILNYCQVCDIDTTTGDVSNDCGLKFPVDYAPATSFGDFRTEEGKKVDDTSQPIPPLFAERESAIGNPAKQDQQPTPSSNQENPSSVPGERLSNSDNLDKTSTQQENDDSSNSKSSNSNSNETVEDNPPQ